MVTRTGIQTTYGEPPVEPQPVPEREGPDPELLKEKERIQKRAVAAFKSLITAQKKDQEISKLHPDLNYTPWGREIPYDIKVYTRMYTDRAILLMQGDMELTVENMGYPLT